MILITIFLLIIAISFSDSQFKLNSIYFSRIAAVSTLFASFLCFNSLFLEANASSQLGKGISIYCGLFQVSYSNLLIETFIYVIGIFIILSSSHILTYLLKNPTHTGSIGINFLNESSLNLKEISLSQETKYYSLIGLFSMLGSSLLLSSCDLLSMYLSIELQSFSLYILATLYRNYSATSAGLKYFLLGGLSSCIILLGSALIYAFTGLTNFDSIYSLITSMNIISFDSLPLNNIIFSYYQEQSQFSNILSNNTTYYNDFINLTNSTNSIIKEFIINMISLTKDFQLGLSLGLILIFSGLLFKISAAPFHNWSPDVYDESPTYVTTWLTVMPKISILILIFEIYFHMALPTHLEEYNSIFISLIELLNPNYDVLSNTLNYYMNSGSLIDNILFWERANETENITHNYNNFSYSLIEEVISDANKTMTNLLTGENSNMDLLTSLRLSTDVILKNILLFSALLSLIIGTVLGLTQIKLKRLLAYSTIVRRCAFSNFEEKFFLHCSYMQTAPRLGRRENLRLNVASLSKGEIRSKQDDRLALRAVTSMVKAILLKVYLRGVSSVGPQHTCNRLRKINPDMMLLSRL